MRIVYRDGWSETFVYYNRLSVDGETATLTGRFVIPAKRRWADIAEIFSI